METFKTLLLCGIAGGLALAACMFAPVGWLCAFVAVSPAVALVVCYFTARGVRS